MAATSQLAFATPPLRVASPNDYVKTHETFENRARARGRQNQS